MSKGIMENTVNIKTVVQVVVCGQGSKHKEENQL